MHKLAFWGFGEMANYHLSHIQQYDKMEVVGAYDVDRVRLKYAKFRGIKAYNSEEELLQDPEVEIVLIATPNHLHKELAIKALRARKHVICEKPAALHAEELEEMIQVSEEVGKLLTVDQNRRQNKDFLLMKKYVEEGAIGDVYVIESRVEGSRGIPGGWRTDKDQGGGMMLDWGVHLIDQIMSMRNEKVVNVFCKMYYVNYEDVDDNLRLTLTFESGLTAHIEVSTNNFITHPRWYVLGSKGTLQIDDWNCNGTIVRSIDQNSDFAKEITQTAAGPTRTMAPRSEDTTERITINDPNASFDYKELCMVYEQLVDSIDNNKTLVIDPKQCLRVMKVMDAAFLSAEIGEAVKTSI